MATITVTTFWNMDSRKWTSDLLGTTEQDPLAGLVQGDIVKFAVRFVQGGAAVVLTAPVFTASGIKALNDFTGGYLIQLSAPVLSDTTLYTFTVSPLNSAQLNTFLQTYRNTWCALELYDSANGILTTPLELQITPGYSLSGTPTDNAPGTLVVAAGKTVTFPLSLTFPSAAGTNGQQLTLSNSTTGLLEWAASGISGITIGTTTANGTAGQVLYTDGSLVQAYAISGTGNVAMTTSPSFTTPSLGAATATTLTATAEVFCNLGVYLDNGLGLIGMYPDPGNVISFVSGTTGQYTATLPAATGTITLNETISGGTLAGSFITLESSATVSGTGFSNYLASPPAIGGSTPAAGSFTTLAASGVASVTNTTDATSTTAASLKTAGGLGVVKTAWLGADIRFATNGAGGAGNIFLGTTTSRAGNGATTTGAQNVCIGSYTGQNLTSGQSNVLIGDQAGSALTTGSFNMCFGYAALGSAGSGADYNIAIGPQSLLNVTNGDNNVGIGRNAGNTVTTGGNNTFIGYDSDGVAGLSNQTAIGVNATCTAANQVMLGTASEAVVVPGTLAVGGGTVVAKLRHGNATLVSGTVTVTDTAITANSRIWVNRFTDGGTIGDSYSITRSAGASFTITSKTANVTAALDTSVVTYLIIEP